MSACRDVASLRAPGCGLRLVDVLGTCTEWRAGYAAGFPGAQRTVVGSCARWRSSRDYVWRVVKSGSTSGERAAMASATVSHPHLLGIRLKGSVESGNAVLAYSKGISDCRIQ